MSTISSFTKDIVNNDLLIKEALLLGITSHAKLAEYIKPQIEKKTGEHINIHTIIMALRRYEERLKNNKHIQHITYFDEISMKTDISYLIMKESNQSIKIINNFFNTLQFNQGTRYHILQNNNEIGVITNNINMKKMLEKINEENIEGIYINLVMMALRYSKTYTNTSEILHNIFLQLARENINIITWIDKKDEVILLISEKDVAFAYNTLHKFKKTIKITPSTDNKKKIKIIPSNEEE